MKKITELSEKEIYELTDEQVELMVKLSKAENGIKLTDKPKSPSYFEVSQPDKTVYSCQLFEDNLVFESIEELNKVIEVIKASKTKASLNYDWQKADSNSKYIQSKLKSGYNSEWHTTTSHQVYSIELYNNMVDMIAQNKKMKEKYEKEVREYENAFQENKWVEDEIYSKVREVREKFWKMEEYLRKYKYDYLPLAGNNEEVAMNFLDKAYSLTEEEKQFIITNKSQIQ